LLPAAERERRNALILQMFLGGWSEREIGRHPSVNLTGGRVHTIIKDKLEETAKQQNLMSERALNIYVARLETLIKAAWSKAVTGDLKAIEVGRRLLEQQARLYDLEEEGRIPVIPPVSDQELDEDDESPPATELEAYRRRKIRDRA